MVLDGVFQKELGGIWPYLLLYEIEWKWKRGQEELLHIRGPGQQPKVPGCNGTGMAERSYPTTEVRGSSREELPHVQGQRRQPRGATLRPRLGAVAESARLQQRRSSQKEQLHVQGAVAAWAQEGLEELFHVQGQEGQQWGDTPHPR